jgi:hypothetical protein
MKVVIRVFALLVAFVGLASASFSSSTPQTLPGHVANADSAPASQTLPYPLPCQSDGSCVAPAQ